MSLQYKDVKILNDLPVWEAGSRYAGKIKVKAMVGMNLMFEYQGCIYDNIYILQHIEECHPKFIIKYNNKKYTILCQSLIKGKIGRILGLITSDFKVEIGTVFNNTNRNITILNREYRHNGKQQCKFYEYKCNICSNEDWISEPHLLKCENGCNVCCLSPRKALLGINTIWDTDRWMCDLGVSEEDAKKHTKCSCKKIDVICPFCSHVDTKIISNIYKRKSIGCSCGDGISYPEKFMFSFLKQLNVEFETEYSPTWIKPKRYDFYIPSLNLIIEADGGWHKKDNNMTGQTKEESQFIDSEKDRLARENGYEVIRIDCFKSDLEYIKNNIVNSDLSSIFDLSKIDWLKCQEFALSNIVKEICNYWNNKEEWETTTDVGMIYNMSSVSILNYLKQGGFLGWCKYNPNHEKMKVISRNAKKIRGKKVEIFKDGVSLGVFNSCHELSRISEEMFGVKLSVNGISQCCLGKRTNRNGYIFKYV